VKELLEREREIGELGAALAEAGAGRGTAVAIEANAGLGKTRLLEESRRLATEAGFDVLSGRATELEREFPFALVRQLFEARVAGLPATDREELLDGAAPARGALGLDPGSDLEHDSFAVLHGIYWVTAALAERKPLLLAIDDAHWSDSGSLDFVGFLLPRLQELPVLMVTTARPDEPDPPPALGRILADPSLQHLTPAPLSSEATGILLAQELTRQPDPLFASTCHEVSGGNPFLMRELARTLAERGIEPVDAKAEAARELAPERVGHTVLMRLRRLPPASRKVAESLVVLGDGSDLQIVAQLAALEIEEVEEAIESLRRSAILDAGPGLRFIHPLVRNVIHANLLADAGASTHTRAAGLLRGRGAPQGEIAAQLLACEPRGDREAVKTLVEAAERSLAKGTPRSAITYLRRALREPPPDDLRAAALGPLITAIPRAADHTIWPEIESDVLAQLEREPSLRSRWGVPLTTALAMGGRFEEAATLLVEGVEVALSQGDLELAFQLEVQLRALGNILPSVPEVDLSAYVDRIDPDSPGGRLAAAVEARTKVIEVDVEGAAAAAKRALGNDGAIFVEESEPIASLFAVMTLVALDETAAVRQAADRALAIARERDDTPGIARGLYLQGIAAVSTGDLAAAEADLRQAVELARLADIPFYLFMFIGTLVIVLVERDELEAADRELRSLGVGDDPMPDGPMFLMMLLARGLLRFARGELEASLEDTSAISLRATEKGFGPGPELMAMPYTVQAMVALGRDEEARELADAAVPLARRWGTPGTLAHVFWGAAAARGGDEAIELLEEAVAATESSPRRNERAHALLALGEAKRRQGARAEARVPLREVFELARRCGARRIAKRAHAELEATGEKLRRYAPVGVESLTPSERRVADLAASGMTNRQIAQTLFVTVKTVEAHLSAAYHKLDIGSRRELAGALAEPESGA
jgi:DNA-binding CsgD family transcriptional regulator/tetratricopeptide (TPR) repeat protein